MGDRVLLLFFLQVIVCKIHKALPVKFLNGMTALTDMIAYITFDNSLSCFW